MDKRKAILNVSVSVGFKLITMILVIAVKRFLIDYCGNEVNGLNALYLSIIGFLAVAELGVGSAISFCMYKPIVEGDNNTIAALYHLLRRLYLTIGCVILTVGLAITPFIKFFAKDYAQVDVNLYLTFILMLISVVATYLFSSKTSLINAYKNNYITTAISSSGILFQYILQIVVLVVTHSYVWYLASRIVAVALQWTATEVVTRKKYGKIIVNKPKLQEDVKIQVTKNVKAMFMHKIGSVLVNTVDSVVISIFVGVVALGEYSNYNTILAAMTTILTLIFTSLTSVMGHLYVQTDKAVAQKYCEAFHFLNFVLGAVFFLGYYAVIDNLVAILFAENLVVNRTIVMVIALNGFVQFMRKNTIMFKDATGTFYNDRYRPLIEGLVNIALSVLFVNFIGVAGVIVATIITNMAICYIIEPRVLYKHAFNASPKRFYFTNYSMVAVFAVALWVMQLLMQNFKNLWLQFFVNGFISVGISVVACGVVLAINPSVLKFLVSTIKTRGKSKNE